MTNLDQFESVFKAAAKTPYAHELVQLRSVLVVTDLDEPAARAFGAQVRSFLSFLAEDAGVSWRIVSGEEYDDVRSLLDIVQETKPGLISTYRNLHSAAWKWSFSLGQYIDVLTQATTVPVLVVPHPEAGKAAERAFQNRDSVMALTDHLAGDARLVNHAVLFTQENGTLYLTHVEDEAVFERYMEVVSKIPSIDTDNARQELLRQLLKEPEDYIGSTKEIVEAKGLSMKIESLVSLGHHLTDCLHLVEKHAVDLLVLNTKDEDQLAMHGLAYPLAVELRQLPLLML